MYQGAIPHVIENTSESFFLNINKLLKDAADLFYEGLKDIPLLTCPHKPEGSMFAMVNIFYDTYIQFGYRLGLFEYM